MLNQNLFCSRSFGFISIGIWCFTCALASVFTGSLEQTEEPSVICFYVFSLASLIFFILNHKHLTDLSVKARKEMKNVLWMNITTAGSWYFFMYPLKYIEPAIVDAIIFGAIPISTLLIARVIYKKQIASLRDYIISGTIALTIIYFIGICFLGKTSAHFPSWKSAFISIVFCILGGISLAFNNIYAKKLSESGFTPLDTLTVRFLLLIFLSGFMMHGLSSSFPWGTELLKNSLIVTLTLVIIPQLAFQIAVRDLQPLSIAIILPLMPAVVFFIQFADSRLHPSIWSIGGITVICLFSIMGAVFRYQTERKVTSSIKNQNTLMEQT